MNLLAAITGQEPAASELTPTELEGITVTAPAKAPPAPSIEQTPSRVPFNYNNQAAAQAVDQAVGGLPTPRGGSANPGIYGLLPERMQHGTLRNVLGAIGDAFLVQSGNDPTYGPRMDRQRIGQAMAGYDPDDPDTVQAAIQRVAATGSPDSIELADRMQKNFNDIQLRQQTAEQTGIYREGMLDSKQTAALQRYLPYVGGMVGNAKTKEQYQAAYDRAELMAQRINPDFTAADFGLVDPMDWTPENAATAGMTANNVQVAEDKDAGRETTRRGQDIGYQGKIDSANINANSRIGAATISGNKATNAVILEGLIDKQNAHDQGRGPPLTAAETTTFRHLTQGSRKGGGRVAPSNVPVKAPAKSDRPIPTSADKSYLKSHPQERKKWDQIYGEGSAAQVLGN